MRRKDIPPQIGVKNKALSSRSGIEQIDIGNQGLPVRVSLAALDGHRPPKGIAVPAGGVESVLRAKPQR